VPLVLAAACGGAAERPGQLHARLTRPPHDTLQFGATARAQRCGQGRGLLLEGIAGGNGVLIWARSGDSGLTGTYPLLARGDSITTRGAMVSTRFMIGDAERGVMLDSGSVAVTWGGGRMTVRALGSGVDPTAGQRVGLDAAFDAVPLATDTGSCRVQL
jgi:hypothetical protein